MIILSSFYFGTLQISQLFPVLQLLRFFSHPILIPHSTYHHQTTQDYLQLDGCFHINCT